ncbi:MAG: transcription antitermination factor NusB [Chloroflexi bacterium]|nr:transcription antitermination factor NusB [Chloroflexota bacterium]|tara:strand:+ start:1701 stop:2063 length:363 start_codon:yes stop_codon:yes gene_type:complete
MRLVYESDITKKSPNELLKERRSELNLDQVTYSYLCLLVESVSKRSTELDDKIGKLTPAWPVEQMARLDVAILRIALSEIDAGDVPVAVSISEAVELAKRYCSTGAARMINGALGSYVRQ